MPKDKDLKRVVRRRMAKTGESYTAARARVLEKKGRQAGSGSAPDETATARRPGPAEKGATSRPDPADYARLAGMSDDAVRAKTGRTWRDWVEVLDAIDAASLPHRDIARELHERHDLEGWWAQTVTVGYERIRGLREKGQRRDGSYEASKSKTFAVPVSRLYRAFADARERRRWLPDVAVKVRTKTADRSVRLQWEDGTPLEVYFYAKGDDRSQVNVQHRKLASKAAAEQVKKDWAARLVALAEHLAGSASGG